MFHQRLVGSNIYVMKLSKGVHRSGTIITVSVATETTLSSLQATDNFIMYKLILL